MRLVFNSTVTKVEERWIDRHVQGAKDSAVFEKVSEGWYVTIGNASIFVGTEPPPFKAGDRIKLTMEKVV